MSAAQEQQPELTTTPTSGEQPSGASGKELAVIPEPQFFKLEPDMGYKEVVDLFVDTKTVVNAEIALLHPGMYTTFM